MKRFFSVLMIVLLFLETQTYAIPRFKSIPIVLCLSTLTLMGCNATADSTTKNMESESGLRDRSERILDESQDLINQLPRGAKNIEQVKVILLGTPNFDVVRKSPNEVFSSDILLAQIKYEPNSITDTEKWFSDNDIQLPNFDVPNPYMGHEGNIPQNIAEKFRGNRLTKAIDDGNFIQLIYGYNFSEGQYAVTYNKQTNRYIRAFDFSLYSYWPEDSTENYSFIYQQPTWVKQVGDVLYVSTSHRTYAASSAGRNGYITAIEASTGDVLWRSPSQIANTLNFELIGDTIVAGYGFTAEEDFLYLIDRYTGQITQTIEIKTAADFIIKKGDRLFVRTYDSNYEYKIIDQNGSLN